MTGEELIARSDLRKTAFYNDYSRRFEIGDCLAAMIEAAPDNQSLVSVNAADNHPFGQQALELMTALMPHLQRALQLHRRLAESEALARFSLDTLDGSAHGVLLLDSGGRVTFASKRARDLLSRRDGLSAEHGELRGANAADLHRSAGSSPRPSRLARARASRPAAPWSSAVRPDAARFASSSGP